MSESIHNFYIFKGKKMRHSYITKCEIGVCMAMQPRASMTSILFSKWILHFVKCIQAKGDNMCVRGHNSHVIIDVVVQTRRLGLDLLTLPSHTSHAFHPLDISCFKNFKSAFCHCCDIWGLTNKGIGA